MALKMLCFRGLPVLRLKVKGVTRPELEQAVISITADF